MNNKRKSVSTGSVIGLAVAVFVILAGCEAAGAGSETPDGDSSPTITADAYEPDDSQGSATVLAESASGANRTLQEHTLHTSSDEDWIAIEIPGATGSNLYIYVEPVQSNDPADGVGNIDFQFRDSGGTVIDRDDSIAFGDGTFGNSTEIGVLPASKYSASTTYYIRVFAADSSTGVYQISWYVE
jgi:hypothetical protein